MFGYYPAWLMCFWSAARNARKGSMSIGHRGARTGGPPISQAQFHHHLPVLSLHNPAYDGIDGKDPTLFLFLLFMLVVFLVISCYCWSFFGVATSKNQFFLQLALVFEVPPVLWQVGPRRNHHWDIQGGGGTGALAFQLALINWFYCRGRLKVAFGGWFVRVSTLTIAEQSWMKK